MKDVLLSVVSLVISMLALFIALCIGVKTNTAGVLVAVLGVLVTALIGFQIAQYLFVDKKIEDIASKKARIIARKSANDIARKTAEEAIEDLAKDTTIIAHGKEKMKNVPNLMMFGEYIKSIDDTIEAINIFKTCKYSTISDPAIEDALLSLDKVFEDCLKQEVPRYLEDKRDYYISVLKDVHNSRIEKCISYLQSAKGYPASIDYDIRESKDKKELDAKLRGEKSD